MSQTEKITWQEMQGRFPNEWLMLVDFDLDDYSGVSSGVVLKHSASKEAIYEPMTVNKPVFFIYTGESTFH